MQAQSVLSPSQEGMQAGQSLIPRQAALDHSSLEGVQAVQVLITRQAEPPSQEVMWAVQALFPR